jgi:hypothetical protein
VRDEVTVGKGRGMGCGTEEAGRGPEVERNGKESFAQKSTRGKTSTVARLDGSRALSYAWYNPMARTMVGVDGRNTPKKKGRLRVAAKAILLFASVRHI